MEEPRRDPSARTVAIVGAGPRGTSVLERLSAHAAARPGTRLHVHVFDDAEAGPGEIWAPEQPRELQLNGTARQVTLFTDETTADAESVRRGPDLYGWALLVAERADRIRDVPAEVRALFDSWTPKGFALAKDLLDLCRTLTPATFPPRALYGAYLRWFLAGVSRTLPPNLLLTVHRARATEILPEPGTPPDPGGGRWRVGYRAAAEAEASRAATVAGRAEAVPAPATAGSLTADVVVLALGWVANDAGPHRPSDSAVAWLPPGHVLRHDLDRIPDRSRVVVRGLGLTAIDIVARLTEGRGGSFSGSDADTRYAPSGREPSIYLTSPSGDPYRCKPADYGPEAGDHALLKAAIAKAGAAHEETGAPVDFSAQLYPAVLADATIAYYRARVRLGLAAPAQAAETDEQCRAIARCADPDTDPDTDPATGPGARGLDALLAAACPDPAERFDATRLRPRAPRELPPGATYARWLRDFLAADAARAEAGPNRAINAAIGNISSARLPLAHFTRGRVLTSESFTGAYRAFRDLGGRLGGGPPPDRFRKLVALMDAEVVTGLGAAVAIRATGNGTFKCTGPHLSGPVTSDALVDGWLAHPRLADTADPLVKGLREAGVVRRSALSGGASRMSGAGIGDRARAVAGQEDPGWDAGSGLVETDSIDIDEDNRVIAADGRPHAGLFSLGLPNDDVSGHSFVSPHPGTGAAFLKETDRVARLIVAQ